MKAKSSKCTSSQASAVTDEDIIMEVQNDKAIVEVPCPVNGKVLEVLVKDGQVCHVGEIVAIIDAEGEVPEQAAPPADSQHFERRQQQRPSAAPSPSRSSLKLKLHQHLYKLRRQLKRALCLQRLAFANIAREKSVDLTR